MSLTLRDYLSHEWQDIASVSREIYRDLGIPLRPERLARVLVNAFPDVVVDGILIRIQPAEREK